MKRFFLLFTIILVCGCTPIGKSFVAENVPSLKLGELKSSEYIKIFGEPTKTSTTRNDNGNYETAYYFFGLISFTDIKSRELYLEFKNELLNGYHYLSSFKDDKTEFDAKITNKIEINKSTKSEVLQLLSEPSGKALCPTTLFPPSTEKCESGGEIWSWHKSINNKYSLFYIVFNQNSVATSTYLKEDK